MKHLKLFMALLALVGVNLTAKAQTWTDSELTDGGKYVFQNVGAGRYLGPGNSWGTQASLVQFSHYNTIHKLSDGKYQIESQVSNGGTAYYFNGSFLDNGSPISLTIQDNGNGVYTISDGTNYYGYDGSSTVLASNLIDPTAANAQWKIMAYDEAYANASEDNPVDVTYMILCSNFDRNHRSASAWTMVASNQNLSGGDDKNKCAESWQAAFTLSQAIDVPNGYYKLRAQAALTEYTVTGNDFPVVYATSGANTVSTPFKTMQNGENSMNQLSDKFTQGNYFTDYTDVITVTNGHLTVGAKGTRTNTWCVWDNFQLLYMGAIDLSEYANQLATAVAAAEAVEGTVPAAVYAQIESVVTEQNKTYTTAEEYAAAIEAINTAVAQNATSEIVAAYSRYQSIRTAVLAVNSGIDVAGADATANAATTTDGIETAVAEVRQALADYLPTVTLTAGETIDLTDALIDNAAPGNSGNTNYWTNSENPGLQYNLWEFYNKSGATTKQTIATTLPAGNYKLTAIAFTRTGYAAKLNAGNESINIATVASTTVNDRKGGDSWIAQGNGATDLVFDLTEATSGLEIGLTADNANGDHWMCWRSFRLVYGDVFEDYTLVEGKMNNDVVTAQTSADETFQSNKTLANYKALLAAIADAQASVEAYANAKTELDKIVAELNGTNLYTAEAYKEQVTDNLAAYEDGTLTTEAANAITMLANNVWHAANTIDDVIISAWDSSAENWDSYHVNTWSTEGDSDGSDFKAPFIEYWVDNANALAAKTLTATLDGIEAGNYKVTATVRVRIKNGASGATGITMQVCDGTTMDVTNGEQIGTTQFYLKEATAFGKVGDDGKLVVKFDVASDNNISWLAFKNVNFEVVNLDFEELMAAIDAANTVNSDMEVAALTTAIATAQEALEATTQDEVDAATEAIKDATDAAKTVIVARKNLAGVAKKADALKSFIDEDITEDIAAAKEYAANAEATAEEADTQAEALNANFAEWDVVTISNGTFDTGLNGELIAPGTTAKPYVHAVDGWTQNFKFSSTASQGIAAAYGSAAQDGTNGTAAPATDMYGKSEGGTLHLSSGWNDQARYYQVIDNLPAGKYVFYYEGINANNTTAALNSNYFGIGNLTAGDLDGTNNTFKYSDEKSFAYNEWKATAFDFTLKKEVNEPWIHVGVIGGTAGSASTPKMWFDNVTIYCISKSEVVTIKNGRQYTAFSSAKALDFTGTGLKAEIVVSATGATQEVTKVPANTGVIVGLAEAATEETKIAVPVCVGETDDVTGNLLVAVVESATIEQIDGDNTNYVFGKKNGKEAFFKVPAAGMTVPANNAYLSVPTATGAKEVIFLGGETTGISNVDADTVEGDIYTVSGVKVQKAQKGVYIVNGKKLIVK